MKGLKRLFYLTAIFAAAIVAFGGCASEQKDVTRVTAYVATETRATPGSTADVVSMVAESVVEIRTESVTTQWGMQYVVSGAGSGVIVAHDSDFQTYYIVTNNHVIEGARQIKVSLRSGGADYSATLIASDVEGDIAVISIKESSTLNVAVWGHSSGLLVGEDVIAIGNPLGSLGGTVTKGIISATERSIPVGNYTMTLLQTDTAINPGNSGGGLFNMRGELVGVVNAKTSDEEVEGICFAIPADTARKLFDDLVTNGVVSGRVTLGISVGVYDASTVYVTTVGEACDGDFKQYDRIAKINDVAVTSLLTYHDALSALKPDEKATVTVYRHIRNVQGFFGSVTPVFSDTPTEITVTAKQLKKGESI
ncbi:MAG: trypsin-like peptidase domain-containing protein [Clostridiales bacterium]|nr:trypsin-like peptidase domain-containing protein [Clostridiales bacterium]